MSQGMQLLNWDHALYPTSVEDLIENLREEICYRTGWKELSITVKGTEVTVAAPHVTGVIGARCGLAGGILASFDARTGRCHYGRLYDIGMRYSDIPNIAAVLVPTL